MTPLDGLAERLEDMTPYHEAAAMLRRLQAALVEAAMRIDSRLFHERHADALRDVGL